VLPVVQRLRSEPGRAVRGKGRKEATALGGKGSQGRGTGGGSGRMGGGTEKESPAARLPFTMTFSFTYRTFT